MKELNIFIKSLKPYRQILPKQTIKSLKGQAISGDVQGAIKGLHTALDKHDVITKGGERYG